MNLLRIAARVSVSLGQPLSDRPDYGASDGPVAIDAVASNELKDEADVKKIGQTIGDMLAEILGTKTKFDGKSVRDTNGQPDKEGITAIKSNMDRIISKLVSMGLRKVKDEFAIVQLTNDAGVSITLNKVPPNDTLAVIRASEK